MGLYQSYGPGAPLLAGAGPPVLTSIPRHATNLFASTVLMSSLTPSLGGGLINCRTLFDARKCFVRSDPAVDALLEVDPYHELRGRPTGLR